MTPSSDTAPAASDIVEKLQSAIELTERLDLDYDDAIVLSRAMNRAKSEIHRLHVAIEEAARIAERRHWKKNVGEMAVGAEIAASIRALPSTAETPSAWRDAMAKLIEASENIANQLERIGDYRKDRFFIQDVRDAIQAIRALIPPKEQEG